MSSTYIFTPTKTVKWPSQASKMKFYTKINNVFQPLSIFAKSCILDV